MDKEVLFAGEFIIGAETSTLQAQQICDFLEKYLYNGNIAPRISIPRAREAFSRSIFIATMYGRAISCCCSEKEGLVGVLTYHSVERSLDDSKMILPGIHIDDLAVASEFASTAGRKGRGIGRAIMTYLEIEALNQGQDFISLLSSDSAVPFYLKQGFSSTSSSEHSLKHPMIKHLHPQQ